jgi:hypothetical protein
MPNNSAPDIPAIILQSAQVFLRGIESARQAEAQRQQVEQTALFHKQQFELQQQNIVLREENLKFTAAKEKRVAEQGAERISILREGLDIRKEQGEKGLELRERAVSLREVAKGPSGAKQTAEALRTRKLIFDSIEQDAALREDAPLQFQTFGDTAKLTAEMARAKSRLTQLETAYLGDKPEGKAVKEQIKAIDDELNARGKYKRNALSQVNILTTLEEAKMHLPSLIKEEEKSAPTTLEPISANTTGIEVSNPTVLEGAVKSIIGQDTTYDPETATRALREEYNRVRQADSTGAAARNTRAAIYKTMRLAGLDNTQIQKRLEEMGIR